MRRPEIFDFLRAEGLTVVETNGWRTRGSATFDPQCSLEHHTAGATTGTAPSLRIVLEGRSDLPGPLCTTLQSRDVDIHGLNVVYLVAAGRANHAGPGGWRGATGNTEAWGNEVEHVGTLAEPFSEARKETSTRIHTAFAKCAGYAAGMVCHHLEWATPKGRKTDFIQQLFSPADLRIRVANRLAPPVNVPPITSGPGSMEDAVRLTVQVPIRDHRGYVDLRKGTGGLPATIGADRVLAATYAGDNPADGWGPKALAPVELVDAGGIARIVVPAHEVKDGDVGVYVTVAD